MTDDIPAPASGALPDVLPRVAPSAPRAGSGQQTTDTLPSTMHDHRPAAEVCRARGWRVGQRLVGDEGHGPTVIEITAVGEATILAKTISHNGEPAAYSREGGWALWCRDWRPA
jgi:hypothetical protein